MGSSGSQREGFFKSLWRKLTSPFRREPTPAALPPGQEGPPRGNMIPAPQTLVARVNAVEGKDRDMLRLADEAVRRGHPAQAVVAYWKAVHVYRKNGQSLKAVSALKMILKYAPHDIEAAKTLVEVYEELDRKRDAALACVQAAQMLAQQGETEEALKMLYHCAELEPHMKGLPEHIRSLGGQMPGQRSEHSGPKIQLRAAQLSAELAGERDMDSVSEMPGAAVPMGSSPDGDLFSNDGPIIPVDLGLGETSSMGDNSGPLVLPELSPSAPAPAALEAGLSSPVGGLPAPSNSPVQSDAVPLPPSTGFDDPTAGMVVPQVVRDAARKKPDIPPLATTGSGEIIELEDEVVEPIRAEDVGGVTLFGGSKDPLAAEAPTVPPASPHSYASGVDQNDDATLMGVSLGDEPSVDDGDATVLGGLISLHDVRAAQEAETVSEEELEEFGEVDPLEGDRTLPMSAIDMNDPSVRAMLEGEAIKAPHIVSEPMKPLAMPAPTKPNERAPSAPMTPAQRARKFVIPDDSTRVDSQGVPPALREDGSRPAVLPNIPGGSTRHYTPDEFSKLVGKPKSKS